MRKFFLTFTCIVPLTLIAQEKQSIDLKDIPFTGYVEILWDEKVGPETSGQAITDSNNLYLIAAKSNVRGRNEFGQLCALNKKDGTLIWKSDKQVGLPLHHVQIDGNELFYTTRNSIVSVDKTTGKTNWAVWNPFSVMIGTTCGIHENVIVAGTPDGELFAVSRQDGKMLWKKKISDLYTPPIYTFKDVFLVACPDDGIYALDVATGNTNWYYKSKCSEFMSIQENKCYFGNGYRGFTCLNLDTGTEVWTKEIDDGNPFVNGKKYSCPALFSAEPKIIGDVIYGGDNAHTVASMDKHTGEIIWIDYFPDKKSSRLIIYKDCLLMTSIDAFILINVNGKIVSKDKIPSSMIDKEFPIKIFIEGEDLFLTNSKGKVARAVLKNN